MGCVPPSAPRSPSPTTRLEWSPLSRALDLEGSAATTSIVTLPSDPPTISLRLKKM